MNFATLAYPAVVLVSLTALILLISRGWRSSILALAIQYLGVCVLVAIRWPLQMAVAKLVSGWIAGAVLGMALIGAPQSWSETPPKSEQFPLVSGLVFRFLAAVLVWLAVLSVASKVAEWVPGIGIEQTLGGMTLVALGLLHLGLTAQPLRTILGLLTVLSGFEILYAAVESSTLVSGLLAGVNLGLAFVGAYMLMAPTMEDSE